MPLSDDDLRAVELDQTSQTADLVCAWCLSAWPCRRADYADELRRRHASGPEECRTRVLRSPGNERILAPPAGEEGL